MANEPMEPYVLDFPNGERVDEILKKAEADYSREEIDEKFDGLDLVGKTFEVEGRESTGEIFNDYVNNVASGDYSHAEGFTTNANGLGSHAEGPKSNARSQGSHAEGDTTDATAPGGHSEGLGSKSHGPGAHAEGICSEATNPGAHSEGSNRTSNINDGYANAPQSHGPGAHAEGHGRRYATAPGAHVEGGDGYQYYISNGKTAEEADELIKASRGANTIYAHAEGMDTNASWKGASHAEGMRTEAMGLAAHAEGFSDITLAHFTEPYNTKEEIETLWKKQTAGTKFSCAFGDESHVEGGCNLATGVGAHAEGGWTLASGKKSHAEGSGTQATGDEAHAEGAGCIASGNHSHAEGAGTTASGQEAHAEGSGTRAMGYGAHVEGKGCESSGEGSHAEGQGTKATSGAAHAEGGGTLASGFQSHAEGSGTRTMGMSAHAEGGGTTAYGNYSHAEGQGYIFPSTLELTGSTTNDEIITAWNDNKFSLAKGFVSHVEGMNSLALGDYSHAEGYQTIAEGGNSHAEGGGTKATGHSAHAEGDGTIASGSSSHAEGGGNGWQYVVGGTPNANGSQSHAEGGGAVTASGDQSHAEGASTEATGWGGHSEGIYTKSSGDGAHAEGMYYVDSSVGASSLIRTIANGMGSHAEGVGCQAESGAGMHVEGYLTKARYSGGGAHAEGYDTEVYYGTGCHAEGYKTSILGKGGSDCKGNHIEGISTNKAKDVIGNEFLPDLTYDEMKSKWDSNKFSLSFGEGSHVEGKDCVGFGNYSHVEGLNNKVNGECSHAEGDSTTASGSRSHAEGFNTTASGNYSHAEGSRTKATGDFSHAEGAAATASGSYSHVEGTETTASGFTSHAEGYYTTASGSYSHAEGQGTTAASSHQHVQGKYNKPDDTDKYAFIIGNGTNISNRSNAIAIDWNGKIYVNNSGTGVDLRTVISDIANRYTKTETDSAIAAKISEIIANAPESLDTLKEIADWIDSHAGSAAAMNSAIQKNTEDTQQNADDIALLKETTINGVSVIGELDSQSNLKIAGKVVAGTVYQIDDEDVTAAAGAEVFNSSDNKAIGSYSHAEGVGTIASGVNAHAEGIGTIASGDYSHAEGAYTTASGDWSHAEGRSVNIKSKITSATASDLIINAWKNKEFSLAKEDSSHVEGSDCLALTFCAHAEGHLTIASGMKSHSEGYLTTASGQYSHAEGQSTTASGQWSHAEGYSTTASGDYSHAEGDITTADGMNSHAEGYSTTASGYWSHAEGYSTTASGNYSHAEGYQTTASGGGSHAEGNNTIAASSDQHVQGKFNIEDTDNRYAFIIGNGTKSGNEISRSNALAIDWEGKIYVNNSETGVDLNTVVQEIAKNNSDMLKVEGEIEEINNTVNALDTLIIGKDTESVSAILYPRKNAYLQEYELGDFINIIDSPTRAYTILDINGSDNIIVTPKTGFACSATVKVNGVYSQIHTWATESFVVTGAATECVLAFKHDDDSEFSATTTIDDVVVLEKQYVSIGFKYQLISTATLENVFSDVDSSVQGEAMQGMCSDGEYIYYYHDYPASIWKYKISTGEVTKKDTDCEHGNDMTYNNLTGRLYVCACESNLIYVVDKTTLEVVETIDMTSKINGKVASISYVRNLNKYVIVGGEAYSEEKNTQSWTYKNMYVLNEYFNVEKTYLLENDTFANQGIETDDRYIYVLCTEVDGDLRHNYIKTYDLNGKLIGKYHVPTTEEAEALIKVSDTKFYISFNLNKGGTINHLIISDYADISYFDVMTRYQLN